MPMDLSKNSLDLFEEVPPVLHAAAQIAVEIINTVESCSTSKSNKTRLKGLAHDIIVRLLSISQATLGEWQDAPHELKHHIDIDELEVILREVLKVVTKHSKFSPVKALFNRSDREKEIKQLERRMDDIQKSVLRLVSLNNGSSSSISRIQRLDRGSHVENEQFNQTVFAQNTVLCLDGRVVRNSFFPTDAGGYADVFVGDFDGLPVAIKVVRPFGLKWEKILRRLWREYLAWSRLSHPNILPCLGYSYDFSGESYLLPSLISPWMANGTITSYLGDHPEANGLKLLHGVVDGLTYLHSRDPVIVHDDLRGGNILVSDEGVPCLTDFGLSRIIGEIKGLTTSSEYAGTVRWMAPELFQNEGQVTAHSDIWAFGMTALEVLSGQRPYSDVRSDLIVLGQIREGRLPSRPEDPTVLEVLNDAVWEMCQLCWSHEPTARPSGDVLMKHDVWFPGNINLNPRVPSLGNSLSPPVSPESSPPGITPTPVPSPSASRNKDVLSYLQWPASAIGDLRML